MLSTVGVNLFNLLMWVVGPYDMFTFGMAWAVTVPVMAANRILLNMREEYYRPAMATVDGGTEFEFRVAHRPLGSKGPTVWSAESASGWHE